MSNIFNDVFDGSEIKVEVATTYNENDTEQLTGTVEVDSESLTTVDGTDTLFKSELESGDTIKIDNTEKTVDEIISNTQLTVTVAFDSAVTAGANIYKIYDPAIGWNYEVINFRRDFNPDTPDNTRPVYEGLRLKGKKKTRAENKIALTQEFQGFGTGLYDFENKSGLLVKATIEPEEGSLPESVNEMQYYTNWCPYSVNYNSPDEGEIEASLEGMFDEVVNEEPVGTEVDWAEVINE